MAQFRSASREGNFAANQLVVPDTISKLKIESDRQLRGMDTAQRALEKQRSIFLDSQKTAQQIQRQGAEAAFKVEAKASSAEAERSKELWQRQLAAKEAEDKYKVDTYGALASFSKTAFNITSDIVKQNKANQLKAVNEIAFKQGYSYDDVLTAASVDASISQAEWMRTNTVKDMLASGKTPEYAKVMYEHMIKGGGYRNYMHNKDILVAQGRTNASEILLIAGNKDLSIEERRTQIETVQAQQRAALTIDGEIPNPKILESAYNPTIRSALDKSEEVLMGATLVEMEEATRIDQAVNINNAVFPGGDAFFPEAGFELVSGDPRKGAIDDYVKQLVSGRQLSEEQIAAVMEARFEKNGKMITLEEGGYTTALTMLDTEYTSAKEASRNRIVLEQQEEELEIEQWWMQNAQLAIADGRYTKKEHEALINDANSRFGRMRSRKMDELLEKETVSAQLRPLIIEDLKRRAMDGSLTEKYMMDVQIPLEIQNSLRQFAKKNDEARANPEYKAVVSEITTRVEQAMAENDNFTLIEGRFQSDQAQWFLDEQVKKYKKKYFNAMLGGADQAALNSILDEAAYKTSQYLSTGTNYIAGQGFSEYHKYMSEQKKKQLRATQAVSSLNTLMLDDSRRIDPREWIKTVGEAPLIEAAEELRTSGDSVLLEQIATKLKKTPVEVVNELATVSEGIDFIVTPASYQEMLDTFTPRQRFDFTSDLVTNEKKLRAVREQMGDLSELPRREAYQIGDEVGSFPEGTASDSLLDVIISGEGGYDSVNRGNAGDTPGGLPGLSSKTIGEVMELQRSGGLFAVGAPQFIPATLKTALKDSGLSTEDKFSPENQRRMAFALMTGTKRPRLAAYLNGSSDDLNAAHEDLSLEWASVQGPSGRGAYDGDSAGNYAHTSGDSIRKLLIQAREENLNR